MLLLHFVSSQITLLPFFPFTFAYYNFSSNNFYFKDLQYNLHQFHSNSKLRSAIKSTDSMYKIQRFDLYIIIMTRGKFCVKKLSSFVDTFRFHEKIYKLDLRSYFDFIFCLCFFSPLDDDDKVLLVKKNSNSCVI